MNSPSDPPDEPLVTAREAEVLIPGVTAARIQHWRTRGAVRVAGSARNPRGALARTYRPADLRRALAESDRKGWIPQPPDGYVTCEEAGVGLGSTAQTVRKLVSTGILSGIAIPMKGNYQVRRFPLASAVAARVAELAASRSRVPQVKRSPHGRPLISPDDQECLDARLALWAANGRVFRWGAKGKVTEREVSCGAKVENALDAARKAG